MPPRTVLSSIHPLAESTMHGLTLLVLFASDVWCGIYNIEARAWVTQEEGVHLHFSVVASNSPHDKFSVAARLASCLICLRTTTVALCFLRQPWNTCLSAAVGAETPLSGRSSRPASPVSRPRWTTLPTDLPRSEYYPASLWQDFRLVYHLDVSSQASSTPNPDLGI